METESQIYFRKYSEHLHECVTCQVTPRSEKSMCELGLAILQEYRKTLVKEYRDSREILAKMDSCDLARVLQILEDKSVKTDSDESTLIYIDRLLKERVERTWNAS